MADPALRHRDLLGRRPAAQRAAGRIYREIAELGRRSPTSAPQLVDYPPDADVALLYSIDTKRSFEFYPPLADAQGQPDRRSYLRIFDRYYRAAFEAGAQARIVHVAQFLARDAAAFVAEFPTLVVPTLYVADDRTLDALVAYAKAGGHLVVGARTGYGDELARARAERAPGAPRRSRRRLVRRVLDPRCSASASRARTSAAARPKDGRTRSWSTAPTCWPSTPAGIYAGQPAVTSRAARRRPRHLRRHAARPRARDIHSSLGGAEHERGPVAGRIPTVTVTSGTSTAGRIWFVSNWSPDAATAHPPRGSAATSHRSRTVGRRRPRRATRPRIRSRSHHQHQRE